MTPAQFEGTAVAVGASTTLMSHLVAIALAVDPVIHALADIVSVIVGVLTGVWVLMKIINASHQNKK